MGGMTRSLGSGPCGMALLFFGLSNLLLPKGLWAREGEGVRALGEKTARQAAKFLLSQANPDGTFGHAKEAKWPGLIGLAVYALVTCPVLEEPAKLPAIQKAAEYLINLQMENGAIAIKETGMENYNTSLAVLALKALDDPKYAGALEKAKAFILSCQLDERLGYDPKEHPRAFGGFGYGSSRKADLSNTSFSLEALKALGIKEDSKAFENARLFIKRCQDNDETNDLPAMKNGQNLGGFVYLPGEGMFGTIKGRSGQEVPKPYGGMTYTGIKSLIYCGIKDDSPELQAAWRWIRSNYSVREHPGGQGTKGYLYYLVAFAKAFSAAGISEFTLQDGKKVSWAKDLIEHLAQLQKATGQFANEDPSWMEADPIVATSYALQALNLALKGLP